MKRFIKPGLTNSHHKAITEFSETSSPISAGVTRGYSSDKYAWESDASYKHKNNFFTNSFKASTVFYSDRETVYLDYKGVTPPPICGQYQKTSDIYKFMNKVDAKTSGKWYELDSNQYSNISQKGYETDFVAFSNDADCILTTDGGEIVDVNGLGSRCMYLDMGIRYQKNDEDDRSITYLWIQNWQNSNYDVNHRYNHITVTPKHNVTDEVINGVSDPYMAEANDAGYDLRQRLFSYQINMSRLDKNDIKYESTASAGLYKLSFSDSVQNDSYFHDCNSISALDEYGKSMSVTYKCLPEIFANGRVYKRTYAMDGSYSAGTNLDINYGVKNNEHTDQSRISYKASSHMIASDAYFGEVLYSEGTTSISGIDVVVEANRRCSSTVTTEPYMTTEAMEKGSVALVKFINHHGYSGVEVYDNPFKRFVKIAAPRNLISAIDNALSERDFNSDIIETVVIEMPYENASKILRGDTYYTQFGGYGMSLPARANMSLFDRVSEDGADDVYYSIFIPTSYSKTPEKYSDNKMRVAGMSTTAKKKYLPDGSVETKDYLILYCNNYVPENAINKVNTEVPTIDFKLFHEGSFPDAIVTSGELFRPMIKVHGVNGFVKLTGRSKVDREKIGENGLIEVVYNAEIPFAAGTRTNILYRHFSESYAVPVLKKTSYINAGSREVVRDSLDIGRISYDSDRYIPYGDDSFCHAKLFNSRSFQNKYVYNYDGLDVLYSGGNVWESYPMLHLSMTRPSKKEYMHHGVINPFFYKTYIGVGESQFCDCRVDMYVDNRAWVTSSGKNLPYIGRENPAYVFESDLSSIYNTSSLDNIHHSSIPDFKRWIYANFTGFASTMKKVYDTKISYTDLNISKSNMLSVGRDFIEGLSDTDKDISSLTICGSKESSSNMVLEILESTPSGYVWSPISLTSNDDVKISGMTIFENLFIADEIGSIKLSPGSSDVYEIFLNGYDEYGNIYVSKSDVDAVSKKSNLVLRVDSSGVSTVYTIQLMEYVNNSIRVFCTLTDSQLQTISGTAIDPDNAGGSYGPVSIHYPGQVVNFSLGGNIVSSNDYDGDGVLDKLYIDIINDDKFVIENKVVVRARVIAGCQSYPALSYDGSKHYCCSVSPKMMSVYNQSLFPWMTSGENDVNFRVDRVDVLERVKKLGTTYFKVASV